MVQLLLDKGAHIETRSGNGKTAIHFAAWRDTDEAAAIFHVLKDKGADLLVRDESGDGCLHPAAGLASTKLLEILLENGADVNTTGCEGWCPLHWAVSKGRTHNAQLLLDADADVDQQMTTGIRPCILRLRKASRTAVTYFSTMALQ